MEQCICGNIFSPSKSGISSKICKNCRNTFRWYKIKKRAVDLFGGKCSECGYDESISALDFHHEDPNTKEFRIASRHITNWTKIEEELNKCVLLCANCHRKHHSLEVRMKFIYDNYESCLVNNSTRDNTRDKFSTNKSIGWPTTEVLIEMIKNTSFLEVGKLLGVSDNTVRKRLKVIGIDPKTIRSIKDNKFI